jgi:hypothetical protein
VRARSAKRSRCGAGRGWERARGLRIIAIVIALDVLQEEKELEEKRRIKEQIDKAKKEEKAKKGKSGASGADVDVGGKQLDEVG